MKTGSGSALLDEAARTAVLAWVFTPGTRHGAAVDSVVEVPITIRLDR